MKSRLRPICSRSLPQQLDDRRLHGHVERGGDLVAHHQLRLRRERAGDRDALALAARELVGEAVRPRSPRARRAPGTRPRARPTSPRPRPPRTARAGGRSSGRPSAAGSATRTGSGTRTGSACAPGPTARARPAGSTSSPSAHLAGVVLVQPGDAARERRLALARLADERQALVAVDLEVDVEQRVRARRSARRGSCIARTTLRAVGARRPAARPRAGPRAAPRSMW